MKRSYLSVIQVGLDQSPSEARLHIAHVVGVLQTGRDRFMSKHKSAVQILQLGVRLQTRVRLTAMTLTKSFSPSVSRMVLMVCLAMVIFRPFMLPLTSTMMMMSFGDVAAWMYLQRAHVSARFHTRKAP